MVQSKRRSTKWYRKNEEQVMEKLGLVPTKNSGAGWIEKEDGQNDYLICQLKSTDMGSIGVKKKDLETLEYNAGVSHKIPVFALQFIGDASDDVWIMVKPEDIREVSKYIETGCCEKLESQFDVDIEHNVSSSKRATIRSGRKAREKYQEESMLRYKENKKKFKEEFAGRSMSWCKSGKQRSKIKRSK